MKRIGMQFAAVQERDVARVEPPFHCLQVIALLPAFAEVPVWCGKLRPFECGQRRLGLGRAHIGPQNPAALDERIGFQLDPLAEATFRRLGRHVHALPGVIIFPAVIGAPQPVLFVAAEPQ